MQGSKSKPEYSEDAYDVSRHYACMHSCGCTIFHTINTVRCKSAAYAYMASVVIISMLYLFSRLHRFDWSQQTIEGLQSVHDCFKDQMDAQGLYSQQLFIRSIKSTTVVLHVMINQKYSQGSKFPMRYSKTVYDTQWGCPCK